MFQIGTGYLFVFLFMFLLLTKKTIFEQPSLDTHTNRWTDGILSFRFAVDKKSILMHGLLSIWSCRSNTLAQKKGPSRFACKS